MAMTAGTVTLNADGTINTKTGAAGELYDLRHARLVTAMAAISTPLPTGAALAKLLQPIADDANDMGAWMVTHLTTNARAKIFAGAPGSGLQTMPASTAEHTQCEGPLVDVTLPII